MYKKRVKQKFVFRKEGWNTSLISKCLKYLSIAEHLGNNVKCANGYKLNKLNIIKVCGNNFELFKPEAFCVLFRKSVWLE